MNSADRAFLNAEFVFGGAVEPDLSVFSEPNRSRYSAALRDRTLGADRTAEAKRLRAAFESQKKADLSKIHPTWLARALQAEPRSVRLAVLSQLPRACREEVAGELAIAVEELARETGPESPYSAVALCQSLSRLVGDLAVLENDHPVVLALTALPPSAAPRMIRRIGIIKWSMTTIPLRESEQNELDSWKSWVDPLGSWSPSFRDACQAELAKIKVLDSRAVNRLGFSTFSRLLTQVDPRRTRWALQQIPYLTAKALQSLMKDSESDLKILLADESRLFKATWIALQEEGAITRDWPSENVG